MLFADFTLLRIMTVLYSLKQIRNNKAVEAVEIQPSGDKAIRGVLRVRWNNLFTENIGGKLRQIFFTEFLQFTEP